MRARLFSTIRPPSKWNRPGPRLGHVVGAAFLLVWLNACRPDPAAPTAPSQTATPHPDTWFRDVTTATGVAFHHDAGARGDYRMHEHIGSGCALFDADNDGRLDLYLVQNGGPGSGSANQLYRQRDDGSLTNVSRASGLDVEGYGMGVAVGDVNNDGWRDLVLAEYGAVRLFLNAGDFTFQEITAPAGLRHLRWATAVSFFDYDRDGWLDLVVGNYVDFDPTHHCYDPRGQRDYCGVDRAPPTVSQLYRNLGPGPSLADPKTPAVRFEDVTVPSGLVHHSGQALGVLCADFNGDHWPDILLADDERPNRLFINLRNGTFSEEGALRGLAFNALGQVAADMGVAWADVDGNGLFDVLITHLSAEFHNLWLQEQPGMFLDRTAEAGLTKVAWRGTGFGAVLADFDLDGDADLAVVNGRIKRDPRAATVPEARDTDPFWWPYAEHAQLWRNDGRGRFEEISGQNPEVCQTRMVGRGLACGDLDNDGDLDLVVTCAGGAARLWQNTRQETGHWLLVEAVAPQWGGRDAIGAEITITAGGRTYRRVIQPSSSYLSSNDPRAHFGLGSATQIDTLEVLWPDGTMERFPGTPANRIVRIAKGTGNP